MSKSIGKRIISLIVCFCIIILSVVAFGIVFNHPTEELEFALDSFYREPEGSLDTVIIGSSAARKDLQPAVFWKENKITSYVISIDGSSATVFNSILLEMISKHPNAVVLVDMDGFVVENKWLKGNEPIERWIDCMPLNKNKIDMINTYCSDHKLEHYLPFITYHKNVTLPYVYVPITLELMKRKATNYHDPLKGSMINDEKEENLKTISTQKVEPLEKLGEELLNSFIELCKKNNVKDVVFLDFPKSYSNEYDYDRNITYLARTNYSKKIIEKAGYTLINYNELVDNPAGLDINADYSDKWHLTTSGAVKYSKYISSVLKEKYSFAPKSQSVTQQWDNDTKDVFNVK